MGGGGGGGVVFCLWGGELNRDQATGVQRVK